MKIPLKITVFFGVLAVLPLIFKINVIFAVGTNPLGGDTVYSTSGKWQFPNIRSGHPRIFLEGPEDVAKLRTRIDTIPEITAAYNSLKSWADKQTTASVLSINRGDRPNALRDTVLVALMEKEKGNNYSHYLNLSKALMGDIAGLSFRPSYKSGDAQAMAVGYDWLFDDLSLSEKQNYVAGMIKIGERLAFQGYMETRPQAAGPKNQLGILFAGIAFYNDGIDDQMARDVINYYGEYTDEIWMPLINIMAGNTGETNQSKNYFFDGSKGHFDFIEMWKSSTQRRLDVNNNYGKNFPYWDIYTVRPDNTNFLLFNGMNIGGSKGRSIYAIMASIYKDPLASYFASLSPKDWRYILWYDPSIPSKSYQSLPLTRYFDGTGHVIMRTGWEFGTYSSASKDVAARFKSGNFYGAGSNKQQNDFVIFYKGSLAAENPGKKNKAAIHHNTIIIDGEDQLTSTSVYSALPGNTPAAIRSSWGENTPRDIADIIKVESSSSYDYMVGDATNAYNPDKLSHFTREFVFVRPNYFVVFDRVNTKSSTYSKKYLLHSINVPKIGGTTPSDGTQTYNSDLIQIDRGGTVANGKPDMNGRLFSKTLLPTNSKITVVGSGQSPDLTDKREPARWRMEVEPASPQQNDFFLHVMQVGDSDTLQSMTQTSRIDANTMTGAFINDPTTPEIVMFSSHPQGADVTSVTYQANYSSSITGNHLLLDMSPGTYDVYKNATKILSNITASSRGVLSFDVNGGATFQVVQTGVTPTQDTIPPSTPDNLTATTISSSQINLSWIASKDNVGVAGYKIYRDGIQITTTANTSYQDTGLSPSTAYTYTVSAYDAAGNESGQSSQVTETTSSEFDTTPPTVTSVSAGGISTQIVVVFSEPVELSSATNISNYNVNNGITVSNASLGSDLKTVTLTTSPNTEGLSYTLTINNVKDRAKIPNVIAPNTTENYTFVSQLVISNLTVASNKQYEVVQSGIYNGELAYIDRTYTYSNIPALLEGALYIKTANDDKVSSGNSFLSFDVNQGVKVYVAHVNKITAKPSWLTSFVDTGEDVNITNVSFSLFVKYFQAGKITLGGNEGSGSMYTVMIVGQGGTGSPPDSTPPPPPTGLFLMP
ncbi:MAG: fibronectin type III domain-containing protein [Candidatus Scalinduaceae bacterium]